ncbi:MAG: oligoribonuclease [Candidatus Saccharibacteria bacterium]|nr:oligoribonuclease [Candidatus Saccharibacteria bacterium]
MTTKKARLLWVDLEMTGLEPSEDKITEVGVIATDFDFETVATYQTAVQVDKELMNRRMTGEFWDKNDATRQALIANSTAETAKSSAEVQSELIDFIQRHFDTNQPIYLAGNSVYMDRKFIEKEWPELNKLLHYRLLDVSSWKIVFAEKGISYTKPELHRAMSDIEGSIGELKYYLGKVK